MLNGERLILRPLKIEDLSATNKWRNTIELTKSTLGIRFPKSLLLDQEWFEVTLRDKSNRNIYFAIETIQNNDFIGMIQVTNIDWISRTGDFGINIGNVQETGKGYGKEAMNLFFNYIFATINLRKINLKVAVYNQNAISSYDKFGFKKEGRLEKQIYYDNTYYDVVLMSIFADDFLR